MVSSPRSSSAVEAQAPAAVNTQRFPTPKYNMNWTVSIYNAKTSDKCFAATVQNVAKVFACILVGIVEAVIKNAICITAAKLAVGTANLIHSALCGRAQQFVAEPAEPASSPSAPSSPSVHVPSRPVSPVRVPSPGPAPAPLSPVRFDSPVALPATPVNLEPSPQPFYPPFPLPAPVDVVPSSVESTPAHISELPSPAPLSPSPVVPSGEGDQPRVESPRPEAPVAVVVPPEALPEPVQQPVIIDAAAASPRAQSPIAAPLADPVAVVVPPEAAPQEPIEVAVQVPAPEERPPSKDEADLYKAQILYAALLVAMEAQAKADVEKQAATTLQSVYKGHVARKSYNELRAAALSFQSLYRGRAARKEVARMHDAATLIQSAYKGHAARKSYNELRDATIALQSIVRGNQVRKSYSELTDAAQKFAREIFESCESDSETDELMIKKAVEALEASDSDSEHGLGSGRASPLYSPTYPASGVVTPVYKGSSIKEEEVAARIRDLFNQGESEDEAEEA